MKKSNNEERQNIYIKIIIFRIRETELENKYKIQRSGIFLENKVGISIS